MILNAEQQKKTLVALVACLSVLIVYRVMTSEKPRTAPLTYAKGAVATSSVRTGIRPSAGPADSLQLFLAQRSRKYPGVNRDIFRMENPVKPKPKTAVVTAKTPTVPPPPPPPTPEEIAAAAARAAADAARADLAKFRFMGYLNNSLFLSKEGQVYIVRVGDQITKTYRVNNVGKESGKDVVTLLDTSTNVEVKVELSGGETPVRK
jgi:hypothetical protein